MIDSPLNPSLNRRRFLKVMGTGSGGLMLAFHLPGCSQIPPGQQENSLRPNAWLEFTSQGACVLTLDRVEMGQGTMTGMATLLGEELDYDPSRIEVVFAPVGKAYVQPDFGLQITGGSTSISSNWVRLREAGASGRAVFIQAAAEVWQVDQSQVRTANGVCFLQGSDKQVSYADLIALAATLSAPSSPELKSADQFRYIGKHNARLDGRSKSFGLADYGIDQEPDDLLYAVLIRAPRLGSTLKGFDAEAAQRMAGVERIFACDAGIAVVAQSYWQARKAAEQVKADWQTNELSALSTEQVFAQYATGLDEESGDSVRDDGDLDEVLATAEQLVEAEYRLPYLAHATMEPQNCTVWIREDRCDVWAPTQGPDIARYVARRASGLSESDIHIHTTFIGGGFGRRLSQDYVNEAVLIAKEFDRPVKLIWSREEDTRYDLYRPASLHRLKAGLDRFGKPLGWHHRIAAPVVLDHYAKDASGAMAPGWTPPAIVNFSSNFASWITPDTSAIEGAEDLPYDFSAIAVDHVKVDPGVPISYWRAVGHSFNGFVVESFMDELAEKAGEDALSFRLKRLQNFPRHQNVLKLAAERAGWGYSLPEGHFHGLAVHKSFGTVVAEIAEVSVEQGRIRVHKVTCAVDCGQVVNPDIVVAQMESGIIFGLTAALYGEITLKEGAVEQSNFHDYPMLRMNESPDIEVIVVESQESPTGVGEPGLPPIAPAVANALYRATGQRLRSLPLRLA